MLFRAKNSMLDRYLERKLKYVTEHLLLCESKAIWQKKPMLTFAGGKNVSLDEQLMKYLLVFSDQYTNKLN